MYTEMERTEDFCLIASRKDGQVVFLKNDRTPFSGYPPELMSRKCPLKSPLVVHLELTRKCGLNCKHCYISGGRARAHELSTVDWKRVLRQLRKLEVLSVYITGGDPLLRPDCLELLKYAQDIGLSCNLLTNGLELQKDHILRNIPKEVFIVLSFDGIEGTKILRGISGEAVLTAIRKLKDENRAFAVQGLVFRDNIEELKRVVAWCAESCIDFSLNDVLPIGEAKKNPELLILERQIPALLELDQAMRSYQKAFVPPTFPYSVSNPDIYRSITELVIQLRRPEPGVFVAYVSSDGYLYPDNYYAAEGWKSRYNLCETSFSEAWLNAFKQERSIRIDHFTQCQRCEVLHSGGICDLQNMAISHHLYQAATACGAYPALKRLKIRRTFEL